MTFSLQNPPFIKVEAPFVAVEALVASPEKRQSTKISFCGNEGSFLSPAGNGWKPLAGPGAYLINVHIFKIKVVKFNLWPFVNMKLKN